MYNEDTYKKEDRCIPHVLFCPLVAKTIQPVPTIPARATVPPLALFVQGYPADGKTNRVWGIEIGQSALKALRCHLQGMKWSRMLMSNIEYPKLLSQPEAEPEVLVAEAMQQFVERNKTREYKVAISVPGQSGLLKFSSHLRWKSKKSAGHRSVRSQAADSV